MKILVYNNNKDFRFLSLTKCLSLLDIELGLIEGTVSKEDIVRFAPDILIHDINSKIKSNEDSFAEIQIDDDVYKKIGPFTSYLSEFITDDESFTSDISYIGSPDDFGIELYRYFNEDYNFKLFYENPLPFFSYCGTISKFDIFNAYNKSRVSLVPEKDSGFRELDIIAAGGTPIVFKNREQFHSEIEDSIKNKKTIDNTLRQSVLKEKTAFDKMANVLKINGLSAMGAKLKSLKGKYIND